MPLSKVLSHFFRNGEETHEKHRDPNLRTRYYRKPKPELMNTIQSIIAKNLQGWRVIHVEETHGEISLEKRNPLGTNYMTITVFNVSPLRSAVDVAASRNGQLGDFGSSYTNILTFFRALNREVTPES